MKQLVGQGPVAQKYMREADRPLIFRNLPLFWEGFQKFSTHSSSLASASLSLAFDLADC